MLSASREQKEKKLTIAIKHKQEMSKIPACQGGDDVLKGRSLF
jgi:hypothetical protein